MIKSNRTTIKSMLNRLNRYYDRSRNPVGTTRSKQTYSPSGVGHVPTRSEAFVRRVIKLRQITGVKIVRIELG